MVTTADLQNEMRNFNWEVLTDGSETAAQRAIDKAVIWVRAKLRRCGLVIEDGPEEVLREVILKRAQYELYSSAEMEEVAGDKRTDALDLLKGYYGGCIDGGLQDQGSAGPVISTSPGESDWNGYA